MAHESNDPIKIAADGMQTFDVRGKVFEVDSFHAWNTFCLVQREHPDGDGSELAGYVKAIVDLGGPPCSHAEAVEVVNTVSVFVEKKKGALDERVRTRQTSPPSTASTPGS